MTGDGPIQLTIEKLVVDGGKGRGTDMRYIYSPGRGLASVDED